MTGMPTLDAFNNDESVFGRIFTTAAHLMLYGIAVVAALRVPYYLGYRHWVFAAAAGVGVLLIILGMIHNRWTRLCVRCMEEVPADAGGRAQREQRVLWFNHWYWSNTGTWVYLGALAAISLLMSRYDLPRITWLPIDLANIVYMYSIWLHHKLRPWCPYCRDWGGGGIHEPSPDPVVKATR